MQHGAQGWLTALRQRDIWGAGRLLERLRPSSSIDMAPRAVAPLSARRGSLGALRRGRGRAQRTMLPGEDGLSCH